MKFSEKLDKCIQSNNSLLCVGLDPLISRLPAGIEKNNLGIYEFCKAIVDATAKHVCAFKPQIAYFSSVGAEKELEAIIEYIQTNYSHVPVILDAKRGDIGSTAAQYAKEAFERYKADCVTLSPYMGMDTIEPYLEYKDKGAFVLCRTSNPGGKDFEMLDCAGEPLFIRVAKLVDKYNQDGQLGVVVGATYPAELEKVRAVVGDMNFLVPGIGAQGGDISAAVKAGLNSKGAGMVINSSRAVIYASGDEDFALRAEQVAKETKDKINQARKES